MKNLTLHLQVKHKAANHLTCRELLNGHRWHCNALRPVSHLRLGKLRCRGGPFALELLLSNTSLLSSSLLLLLNLQAHNKH